jgi:predicted transporter
MSSTLLRLGLWLLVLLMALFVIRESYSDQQFADLIPTNMIQNALVVSVVLIVAGVAVRVLEKGKSAVAKTRCRVCKTPVPSGGIYCRAHLRHVLELEDHRTHNTRIR